MSDPRAVMINLQLHEVTPTDDRRQFSYCCEMLKQIAVVVALVAGCSKSDDCARVIDKMKPMVAAAAAMGGQKEDPDPTAAAAARDREIGKCRDDLEKHPESKKFNDCILAIDGELTIEKAGQCTAHKN